MVGAASAHEVEFDGAIRRSGIEIVGVEIVSSSSEVAVSRVCNVNPAHRTCRDELNSDVARRDGALVPDDVCYEERFNIRISGSSTWRRAPSAN